MSELQTIQNWTHLPSSVDLMICRIYVLKPENLQHLACHGI